MKPFATKLQLLAAMLISISVWITTGCTSSETDLLESVPASAQTVMTVNLNKLAHDAGYTDKNGNIALPDYMFESVPLSPEQIVALGAVVDLEHIVAYSLGGSNFTLTFNIKDEDALKAIATASGATSSQTQGYTVYSFRGSQIAVKDGQGWCAPNAVATAELSREKRDADGSYTMYKGLTEYLNVDRPMSVIICAEAPKNAAQRGKFLCAALSGNQEGASINSCIMHASGEKISMDMLTTLHTDFLRYTPANMNIVFAAGLTDKIDWNDFSETVTSMGGTRARGFFDSIFDILRQADGTVALCADGYTLLGNDPGVLFMAHLPQNTLNTTLTELVNQASSMGMNVTRREDGQYKATLMGTNLYAGSVDGYLSIGSQPFVPTRENSLTTTFEGQRAAAYISLETLAPYVPGCNFGIALTAKTGDTDTDIHVNFPGSNAQPLATLIKLCHMLL